MIDYIELRVILSKPYFEETGVDAVGVASAVQTMLEAPIFYGLRPVVELVHHDLDEVHLTNILARFGTLATAGFLMFVATHAEDLENVAVGRYPRRLLDAWWHDTYTTTEEVITDAWSSKVFEEFALWNANLYSVWEGERRYSKKKFAEWHDTIHRGIDEF